MNIALFHFFLIFATKSCCICVAVFGSQILVGFIVSNCFMLNRKSLP